MYDIKKMTKTALFASLTVAMILPFSDMGNSFAQQTQVEEDFVVIGPITNVNEQTDILGNRGGRNV